MKVFFYTPSERQNFQVLFENAADGYVIFGNDAGKFQQDNTKQRVLTEVKDAEVMFFPQGVSSIVSDWILDWFGSEYVLEKIESTPYLSDDDKGNLANFLEETDIVEGYSISKKKAEPPIPPEEEENAGESRKDEEYGKDFFTLSGQWGVFVSGLTGFLEPVYLGVFVGILVSIVVMAGLKQNKVDTIEKAKGYLQQGQIEEAQKESKKLEDGLDKRRLLIAIHEAQNTPRMQPIIQQPTPTTVTQPPVVPPARGEVCYYQVKTKDAPEEISKKFYGKSDQFAKIWAASTRFSAQGVMEIQRIADGKLSYVIAGSSIQPGYRLVINDPVHRNDCITE